MSASVSSITYDGNEITSKEVRAHLVSAINNKHEFEINDSNLGTSASTSYVKSCIIEYQTGDGQKKRRTLLQGQTFNFGNDIHLIKFPERIIALDAFEHIFRYMDTSDRFKVQRSDFGIPKSGNNAINITLEYDLPDRTQRYYQVREDRELIFKKGSFRTGHETPVDPIPPKPAPCLCPCNSCKLNHQTDEERKAAEEKRAREEYERRSELENLKRDTEEARRLADRANLKSQDTQQQVENLKDALDDVRKLAEKASREAQEASQDSQQTRVELEKTRRELELLRRELAKLADQERGDVQLPKTPVVVKVCFFGSQLLAVVILVTYAVKTVRGEQ